MPSDTNWDLPTVQHIFYAFHVLSPKQWFQFLSTFLNSLAFTYSFLADDLICYMYLQESHIRSKLLPLYLRYLKLYTLVLTLFFPPVFEENTSAPINAFNSVPPSLPPELCSLILSILRLICVCILSPQQNPELLASETVTLFHSFHSKAYKEQMT